MYTPPFREIIRRLPAAGTALRRCLFTPVPPRGFAAIAVTILLAVMTAFAGTVITYSLSTTSTSRTVAAQYNAAQAAESGIRKALFCLNQTSGSFCGGTFGQTYAGEADQDIGTGTFTTSVANDGQDRIITSVGITPTGQTFTVRVTASNAIQPVTETTFDFALHVQNGLSVSNNADILDGPIYSGNDITCGNNAYIEEDVVISAVGGRIDNCDIGGDAYADEIRRSDIEGDCHYNDYWSQSSCGGTLHSGSPTPPAQPVPTIDIPFWAVQAMSGGVVVGNLAAQDGDTIGPLVVTGDLTLGNNVDVTVAGPIWVFGAVSLSNNASMTLDPSFGTNSNIIFAYMPGTSDPITDAIVDEAAEDPSLNDEVATVLANATGNATKGTVSFSNNADAFGSGQNGSYQLFYAHSTISTAIDISNNATGAIFMAPNGGVHLSNNAGAVAIVGKTVSMSNNATLSYDFLDAPAHMTLLPVAGGGAWETTTNTWRQVK